MYAKLVVGASLISPIAAIRDIGRLITSASPNTANLGAFSTASSVIIDNTPAGWTYVGGVLANDQPSIANTSMATTLLGTNNSVNLCFSAPCLSGSALKYCVLTPSNFTTVTTSGKLNNGFHLTGASNASSTGVVTNEGPRYYLNTASGTTVVNQASVNAVGFISTNTSAIIHVIANERHLTIISESNGHAAVWETSMTDVHTFYGIAPFIQHTMYAAGYADGYAGISTGPTFIGTSRTTPQVSFTVFNVTNPVGATNYGIYNFFITSGGLDGTHGNGQWHMNSLPVSSTPRNNTINSSGSPRYIVNPIFFQLGGIGYPVQFVTGVVPVYLTNAQLGNTGDTVDVNGTTYTFFSVYSASGNGTNYGLLMTTGL
jgi:hypothetical protein